MAVQNFHKMRVFQEYYVYHLCHNIVVVINYGKKTMKTSVYFLEDLIVTPFQLCLLLNKIHVFLTCGVLEDLFVALLIFKKIGNSKQFHEKYQENIYFKKKNRKEEDLLINTIKEHTLVKEDYCKSSSRLFQQKLNKDNHPFGVNPFDCEQDEQLTSQGMPVHSENIFDINLSPLKIQSEEADVHYHDICLSHPCSPIENASTDNVTVGKGSFGSQQDGDVTSQGTLVHSSLIDNGECSSEYHIDESEVEVETENEDTKSQNDDCYPSETCFALGKSSVSCEQGEHFIRKCEMFSKYLEVLGQCEDTARKVKNEEETNQYSGKVQRGRKSDTCLSDPCSAIENASTDNVTVGKGSCGSQQDGDVTSQGTLVHSSLVDNGECSSEYHINEYEVKVECRLFVKNKEETKHYSDKVQGRRKSERYTGCTKAHIRRKRKRNKGNGHEGICTVEDCKQLLLSEKSLCLWGEILRVRPFNSREISVFPVTKQGSSIGPGDSMVEASDRPGSNIHQLMDHEVFRLCSFGYARFPPNEDILVTRLANAGFYSLGRSGRVRCFSCGRQYAVNLSGSPLENVHEPHCQRHQLNKPLHEWMSGLSREALSVYFNEYGGLIPTLFDDTEPTDPGRQHASSARESRDGAGNTFNNMGDSLASTISSGYGSRNNSARSQASALSTGADQSDAGFSEMETTRESSGSHDAPNSDPVKGTSNNLDLGNRGSSLPSNLNEVANAVVHQESLAVAGNRNVLTSAARNPMDMDSRNGQGSSFGQAQSGETTTTSSEGAVGGSDHFDLRMASYPQFASTHARRVTFSQWNPDHPHRPENLVAAGFFYAGYADCVRCFFCGLGLKYWRAADIPAYQHARFRPRCVYNRMYKGQEYIDRVQQDINGPQNQPTSGVTVSAPQPAPNPAPPIEPQESDYMRSAAAQEALASGWSRGEVTQAINHIVNELGVSVLELEMLTDVLAQLNPESEVLQASGLGSADSVGTNESEHLPYETHDENDPVDNTIASVRGQSATPAGQLTTQQNAGMDSDNARPAAQAIPDHTAQVYTSVQRENNYLNERTTCSICNSRPVSCIFMPCGHVVACQTCADNSNSCRVCGKNIAATANIFLA